MINRKIYFEIFLNENLLDFSEKFGNTWVMKVFSYCVKLDALKALRTPFNTKIYIAPNNQILILRKDYKTAEQDSIIFDQNGAYLYGWRSYLGFSNHLLRVDPKNVHFARRILERKDESRREESESNHLRNRIDKIETDLQKMMDMVKLGEKSTKRHLETMMLKLDAIGAEFYGMN